MVSERKSEILLESGTNEIEIMEFTIAGNTFGINVAKVREIMMPCPIKPMPHAHPSVEGVFKPRDLIITAVDLPKYLGFPSSEDNTRDLFIHANFNKMHVAFRVHTVVGIDRISWTDIRKPDKVIYSGDDGVVTGLAECEDRLVTILDFEKIVADISPETSIKLSEITALGERDRNSVPIVIAEDSMLLSKLIVECLHTAGYVNTIKFDDGQSAWDYLTGLSSEENPRDNVALVITDIEMPRMDGHRLTKLVKSDAVLKDIPLIIFSSLIDEQMRIKGEELGADEQLSKPEIGNLIAAIDRLLVRGK